MQKDLAWVLGSASASEPMTGPDSELETAVVTAPPSVAMTAPDSGDSSDAMSGSTTAAAMETSSAIRKGLRLGMDSDRSSGP